MKYANKRVKIESKEHLYHVINVTGMVMGHTGTSDLMIGKIGRNLHVCFDGTFDDNSLDWGYDYDVLINESKQLEEIFIPLPDPSVEWDGVEPLRVGHVVKQGEVVAVDRSKACVREFGKLNLYLLEFISPVKSEAQRLVDDYMSMNNGVTDITMYTEWLLNRERSKV